MTNSLSLYIHWPFCLSKCPYCDFNSHVADGPVDGDLWAGALLTEMSHFAAETSARSLSSIFFGGGTPSTMGPEITARLIEAAQNFWTPTENLEITLEANPTSVEIGKLKDFAAAGVNRLSLGVQSFNDKSLKLLGRKHSATEALSAISMAGEIFDRFSFDLIYGLPGQSLNEWKSELNQGIGLTAGHLSLYQLSVEKGTPFFRDGVIEADPDLGADLFNVTQEQTSLAGLNIYEISNHAQPGHECRHNVEIWRGGDYVGIGPGAHGRLTGEQGTHALYQFHDPSRWLEEVAQNGHATGKRRSLSTQERREEIIMTGLRLSEGINKAHFQAICGQPLEKTVDSKTLARLIDGEFLIFNENGLRTTTQGRLCLNAVLAELLG